MNFNHKSVLLNECIEGLNIKEDGIYVDGTLGGAGHSYEICKRLNKGKLIGIDQDENAILVSSKRLEKFGERVIIKRGNFSNIATILSKIDIVKVNGVLLDLGV